MQQVGNPGDYAVGKRECEQWQKKIQTSQGRKSEATFFPQAKLIDEN